MPSDSSASSERKDKSALEIFKRTIEFLGEPGFARVRQARVAVVGLGGVGSHAASALARNGVGFLRLIDFDTISASSLNRHVHAVRKDVGHGKADVLAAQLGSLAGGTVVEARRDFFHLDTAANLVGDGILCVVDAIDSLTPKVSLLAYCVQHQIPVVSSMGAAARSDPTLVRIADIDETRVCPLARVVRKSLRHLGIHGGITTVYSEEPPHAALPPDDGEPWLHRGRRRNRLPSLGTLPGIFGYILAGLVLAKLAEPNAPRPSSG